MIKIKLLKFLSCFVYVGGNRRLKCSLTCMVMFTIFYTNHEICSYHVRSAVTQYTLIMIQ